MAVVRIRFLVTLPAVELPVDAAEAARARFKTFLVKSPLARDASPSARLLEASASDSDAWTGECAAAQSETMSSESVVSAGARRSVKAFVDGPGVDDVLHIPFTFQAMGLDAVPLVGVSVAALALGVALSGRRGRDMAAVAVQPIANGSVVAAAGCKDWAGEGTSVMMAVGTNCLGRAGIDISVVCQQLIYAM